jgi:hypothetical protein
MAVRLMARRGFCIGVGLGYNIAKYESAVILSRLAVSGLMVVLLMSILIHTLLVMMFSPDLTP